MESNYDKYPVIPISGFDHQCFSGWNEIIDEIKKSCSTKPGLTIVMECYQGFFDEELKKNLKTIPGIQITDVSAAYKKPEDIAAITYPDVTDDPVFGKLTELSMTDFFDQGLLAELKEKIANNAPSLVYGTGASLTISEPDILIYADLARWEIQQRMRANQVNNLGVENKDDSFANQYKRAFFVDWRICDRLKAGLLDKVDYLLDTNSPDFPKMITGAALTAALQQVSQRPFRVVPFFDPGPWGGQWMKEVCDLDRETDNFAWCFDCVPEENSLLLGFGDNTVEIPSMNLIFNQPENVLGNEIYECLGPEFPIRFDFLDTMDGGNLSLQVHPSVKYIREQFGITYTQDESYYLLDADDDALVYLGLKEGIDPDEMIGRLKDAQNGGGPFEAEKYVETWKVKKHDHVLIPAGTVHCSGKNSMVLEISATPYIFTFKLWDWGRMGLDGKPRPINIEHGKKVIEWDRTTSWTKANIVNRVKEIEQHEDWREEITGLHELQFIETRRHWFSGKVEHNTNGQVNVLNLVEGREVIVESPDGAFDPFVVHYVETFIIPASVGAYTIRPFGESEGKECATIKAYVRPEKLKAIGRDLWMMPKKHFKTAATSESSAKPIVSN